LILIISSVEFETKCLRKLTLPLVKTKQVVSIKFKCCSYMHQISRANTKFRSCAESNLTCFLKNRIGKASEFESSTR